MEAKCKDRIHAQYKSVKEDITNMSYEELNEYGISHDYVRAGTFPNQKASYKRWQLSWGGPSDEFRLYDNGQIEYWFMDWFDGACKEVTEEEIIQIVEQQLEMVEAE